MDQSGRGPREGPFRRTPARRSWILLLLPAVSVGCARAPGPAPRPPVVIISVDTLRADHLPAYGYRGVRTPAIDALAADSILFVNAYSNVPLTLPSHAVLLTGLLPYENGVRDNAGFRLSPAHPTLAGFLRSHSSAAGAAVSSFVLRGDRGLAAGFDSWDDSMPANPTRERAGVDSATVLQRWAVLVKDRPLFLFLHLYEPHSPYSPPEPFRSRYASSPYDGEIAAADAAVGSFVGFLKRAGLYDRAVLIFVSDHGEGLGDHGEEEHGVFLYREALRVPILLKKPGSRGAGRRISAPVSLLDVVPTVLSLLSIPVPASLHGLSLTSVAEAGAPANRRIYSESLYPRLNLGWSDLASLTEARYHYIRAPRPELYDLAADPGERNDLAPGSPAPLRGMKAALEAMRRPFALPEASSPEELKKLAALGYVHPSPNTAPETPLPDPKDKIESLAALRQLDRLYRAGRYGEAVLVARTLVAREPPFLSAWIMLSDSLARTGRPADAIATLRQGIARAPEGISKDQLSEAYGNLSLLFKERHDLARQEQALREAFERGVASEPMIRDLAGLLRESDRSAEAAALFRSLGDRPMPRKPR